MGVSGRAGRGPLGIGGGLLVCCLAGCATLSEGECLSADWHTIGYEDGAAGRPASHIQAHRKACARYGVAPDFQSYQFGRDAGLRDFCQPEVGYALGARRLGYGGVCPDDLEGPFLESYAAGQRWKAAADRVSGTSFLISTAETRLKLLEGQIREKQRDVRSAHLSPDERAELVAHVVDLVREQTELELELRQLREDLQRHEAALAALGG